MINYMRNSGIILLKNLKNKLLYLFFVSFLISLIFFIFINIGRWLIVYDELPEDIDLIYVFAGDINFNREMYAIDLYEKYPDVIILLDTLWIANHVCRSKKASKLLQKLNSIKIDYVGPSATTLEEVSVINKYCIQKGKKLKIGLVSSPYHMRRIKVICEKTKLVDNARVYLLPFIEEFAYKYVFLYKKWWQRKGDRAIVFSEYLKIFPLIIF